MRGFTFTAALALLSAATMLAQTPAKSTTGAAGLGKADASANADKNIRAYIELMRTDLRSSKSQVMGEVMQLDTDQATKFWPIYKEFESEQTRLGDQVVAAVKKYAETFDKMTDPIADELAEQVLSIEQQRNALKKKYYERVKQALGGIVAMRFLQVENQLQRIIDLQLAAGLPIVEAH